MSRYRDSGAVALGSAVGVIVLVLLLITLFVVIKTVTFVVKTFAKYYQHKALWIALAVCCVLVLLGLWLANMVPGLRFLAVLGVAELLITCLVVDVRNRDTLLRERVNIVDEVLHTSWWKTEHEPISE